MRREAQRPEHVGAEPAVADAQGPDRVPVVRRAERQLLGPAPHALVRPELEGHLQRLLDCRRPIGCEQHVRFIDRHDPANASASSTTTRFPFPSIVE